MDNLHTALLIIDLQIGSFSMGKSIHKSEALLQNVQFLISSARMEGIPIFFTIHNGKKGTPIEQGKSGWNLHPDIQLLEENVIIEKDYPDAFQQTNFQEELTKRGVKRIIIAGIQSEVCVDATCRSASSKGYEVILIEDAHSTYDTTILKAPQIINHHNQIQSQWFAVIKKAKEAFPYKSR